MPAQIIALTCPTCGSGEVEPARLFTYRCRHCRGLFLVRNRPAASTPGAPAPRPQIQPLGPSLRVAAAIVLCVTVGAALGVRSARRPRPPLSRLPLTVPRPPQRLAIPVPVVPASVSVPAPSPPKAALTYVREGRSSTGARFWLVRYANTGTVPIARPAARVSLFDAAGRRVAEQTGHAPRDYLPPGQETPLLVLVINPPTAARIEVAAVTPQAPFFHHPPVALRVREQSVQTGALGPELVGTVRNEHPDTVRFVQLVVVGRDAAGAMVSLSHGYATETTLEAGKESGFHIPLRFYELAHPVRYEAEALGQAPHGG